MPNQRVSAYVRMSTSAYWQGETHAGSRYPHRGTSTGGMDPLPVWKSELQLPPADGEVDEDNLSGRCL